MVERIGTGLEDLMRAIRRARAAQEAYFADHPQVRVRWEEEEAARKAREAQDDALRGYLWRGIPLELAQCLCAGEDHDGRQLRRNRIDEEIALTFGPMCRVTVILAGPVGTGKSIAACRWLMGESEGAYVKAARFVRYSDKIVEDRQQVDTYRRAPALVLDELNMIVDRDMPKVRHLIHDRHEAHRLTVVCVNATPDGVEKMIGAAISRRVYALGRTIPCAEVLCPGEKRRRAARMKK